MDERILQQWMQYLAPARTPGRPGSFVLSRKTFESGLQVSLVTLGDTLLAALGDPTWDRFQEFLGGRAPDEAALRRFLPTIDWEPNPPDRLYALEQSLETRPQRASGDLEVRKLDEGDAQAFDEMTAECSEDDLDAGFVELDHTLVYGGFVGTKMVTRASAYAFGEGEVLFDIGYVTHPDYRGKGYGALCTRALAGDLLRSSKIPQIRVQPQLTASIRLAESLGFRLYGEWTYDKQ